MGTIHLRPTAELATRVLLPGDPGRALALAQELLESPKMFNHNRGLWGYTGLAQADEEPLSIQSTGMGGPSAAIVLEELAMLGVRRAIRVGTCGALDPKLSLGDLVLARETIAADGVGAALAGATDLRIASNGVASTGIDSTLSDTTDLRIAADGPLTATLAQAATPEAVGTIVTTDLFYEPSDNGREPRWAQAGALAIEMEAAALFAVGARRGVAVACLLTVSDVFAGSERSRIADEPMLAASLRMGAAAVAALEPATLAPESA